MIVKRRRPVACGKRSSEVRHAAIDSDYDADSAFFQPATTITVHHL
jgi:hypothetical protein